MDSVFGRMRVSGLVLTFFYLFLNPQSAFGAPRGGLGRFALDAALGWNSDYGVLGAGARAFLTENWDLHATSGGDVVGSVAGAGTAVYFNDSRITCWFVFSCKTKWLVKATALQSYGAKITATVDDIEGRYSLSKGQAASVSLGHQEIYGWGFTMGAEVSYRTWWHRPAVSHDAGADSPVARDRIAKFTRDNLGVGVTVGWRF